MTDVGSITATSVHIDEYYSIVKELIVQLSHSGDAFVKDNTTAFQLPIGNIAGQSASFASIKPHERRRNKI